MTFIGVSENALRIQIWTALFPQREHLFAVPCGTANPPCCSTVYQEAPPSFKGWLVLLDYGPHTGGLRLNLFTYRDLEEWLNEP